MAAGVKLIEGKIGTRLESNKRPRLESALRREGQPSGGAAGYGQPAADIRYLGRPEAGGWTRAGPGARGGGGGRGAASGSFNRRRGGRF
jgi:hypothetical protein